MKVIKKILVILANIIIIAFILTVLLYIVSNTSTESSKNKVPGIGNISFFEVKDDIQAQGIESGDLVFINKAGQDNLKSGDIIAYMAEGSGMLTARVAGVSKDNCIIEGIFENPSNAKMVPIDSISGIYFLKISKLGYILSYAQTKAGIIICIIIPTLLILVYIFIILIDGVHKISRHKRKIMRRRQRRRERYNSEDIYKRNRAVI